MGTGATVAHSTPAVLMRSASSLLRIFQVGRPRALMMHCSCPCERGGWGGSSSLVRARFQSWGGSGGLLGCL